MTDGEIAQRISEAARAGRLAESIERVEIEPEVDEDGEEFIRVMLYVRMPHEDIDDELESTLERIEDAVAEIDDRYASVRFLDAA